MNKIKKLLKNKKVLESITDVSVIIGIIVSLGVMYNIFTNNLPTIWYIVPFSISILMAVILLLSIRNKF
jgi:uncharacterized protein YacL